MDGTLIDTEPYWLEAERGIVEEAGGTWGHDLAVQLIGSDLLHAAAFIRANSPVTLEPHAIVERLLDRVIDGVADHASWRPGAHELLDELRIAGVPTALVTMSWRSLAQSVVDALPPGSFDVVITGDEVSHGKPHPEPYLAAARALDLPPGACIAIEDSPTGVASARAAGVPTIAVPNLIDIPPTEGVVVVDTLARLTAADLVELAPEAASFGIRR